MMYNTNVINMHGNPLFSDQEYSQIYHVVLADAVYSQTCRSETITSCASDKIDYLISRTLPTAHPVLHTQRLYPGTIKIDKSLADETVKLREKSTVN